MANTLISYLTLTTTLSLLLISPCLCFNNVLYSAVGSGTLYTDQVLNYGQYTLVMQGDCNLVLYKSGGVPYWHTNTAPGRGCHVTLHSNGELVVYRYGRRLWSSGVKGPEGSYALVLKYDGTLKVYGPSIWSSTPKPVTTGSTTLCAGKGPDPILWSADVAPIGTTIECNEFKLELLQSCNLTLSNTKTGAALWSSNSTHFFGDCYVNLEPNGEFKIKYLGGDTLWSNKVASPSWSEFVLGVQPDGQLVVYGPSIWTSSGPGAAISMVTAAA